MTAVLTAVTPADAARRIASGQARLVDVREPDEHAREHIAGAVLAPLSIFEEAHLQISSGEDVIFMCRSGARTQANCARLAARVEGQAFVLEGGLNGWKAAGLPVEADRKAPMELMRQVQIAAGGLVLLGAVLGWLVHPGFWGLSAFVGAGLFTAGLTGFCGMARLLTLAPWNRAFRAVRG
ncbi:rhodanese family protein [Brevundimonas sp. 2R-24]|uniref:Rhodanese family protein n=1 Tax=Peiella sedimenti TaxID=3061083 RepID=A0ABT8SPC5_9CAUL|nr:rhodanese family protein [Caulobacteraceae bacterium XZ-24]